MPWSVNLEGLPPNILMTRELSLSTFGSGGHGLAMIQTVRTINRGEEVVSIWEE